MKTPLSYSQCLRVRGRKLPKKKRVRKKAMKRRRKMMKRSPSQRVSPALGPAHIPDCFHRYLRPYAHPAHAQLVTLSTAATELRPAKVH